MPAPARLAPPSTRRPQLRPSVSPDARRLILARVASTQQRLDGMTREQVEAEAARILREVGS